MDIKDIIPVIIILITTAIVAAFGSMILADFGETQCDNDGYTWENDQCWSTYNATDGCTTQSTGCTEASDSAYNASQNSLEGIDNLTNQFPNLALVVIAAIIVGVLLAAFGGSMGRR